MKYVALFSTYTVCLVGITASILARQLRATNKLNRGLSPPVNPSLRAMLVPNVTIWYQATEKICRSSNYCTTFKPSHIRFGSLLCLDTYLPRVPPWSLSKTSHITQPIRPFLSQEHFSGPKLKLKVDVFLLGPNLNRGNQFIILRSPLVLRSN